MTEVVFVVGTWCGLPSEMFGNDGDEYKVRSQAELIAKPLNGDWLDSYKNNKQLNWVTLWLFWEQIRIVSVFDSTPNSKHFLSFGVYYGEVYFCLVGVNNMMMEIVGMILVQHRTSVSRTKNSSHTEHSLWRQYLFYFVHQKHSTNAWSREMCWCFENFVFASVVLCW